MRRYLLPILLACSTAQSAEVDLELSLLVDSSGSLSDAAFALQVEGYARAFESAAVQTAIAGGALGAIAVNLVYWSDGQFEAIPFVEVTASTADDFAAMIRATTRPFAGGSALAAAIQGAVPRFGTNGFVSPMQIIDVSADGPNNGPGSESEARETALAAGIDALNVLVIGDNDLVDYFEANLVGGDEGFAMQALDADAFGSAIEAKLAREISLPAASPAFEGTVPESHHYGLGGGLILLLLVCLRRRG